MMNEDLLDLKLEGFVLNESERVMHGKYKGIEVLVEMYCRIVDGKMMHRISTALDIPASLHQEEFLQALISIKNKYEYVSFSGLLNEKTISVTVLANKEDAKESIKNVVEEVTTLCNLYHLENSCEMCDKKDELIHINLQGDKKLICQECYDKLQNDVVQVEKKQKENVVLGVIGAVLGALIGSILWFLLDQIGFIAGIAGYAIVYCSIKGYSMLGKTISKKGIIICIVVCILMVLAVDYSSLVVSIYREYHSECAITIPEAMTLVKVYLAIEEISRSIIFNLVIGYIFVIAASYPFIVNLWSVADNINRSIELKKII